MVMVVAVALVITMRLKGRRSAIALHFAHAVTTMTTASSGGGKPRLGVSDLLGVPIHTVSTIAAVAGVAGHTTPSVIPALHLQLLHTRLRRAQGLNQPHLLLKGDAARRGGCGEAVLNHSLRLSEM